MAMFSEPRAHLVKGLKRQCLTLHSGLRAVAGSFLQAFKWPPYKYGAASVYEQVGQQQCQGQKVYHCCQCLWGPHVLSAVPPEAFSASGVPSLPFICLL